MSVTAYKDHPLSELLPLMDQAELEELATDIRQYGQRAPITLYENKILDGRNRYRACKLANVEPKVRHFTSGDAVAFIVSANVFRRHLNTSQRALVAAKLANLSNGHRKPTSANLPRSETPVTQATAAKELNVSTRQVTAAKEVLRDAPKKEIKAIERGEKSVHQVAKAAKKKAEEKVIHLDKTGYPIPESVWDDWQRAEAFAAELREISRIKGIVEKGLEEKDVIFAEIKNTTIAAIANMRSDLKRVLPHAVCTSCQGKTKTKCTLCKERGFISQFTYDTCVPMETKTLRERVK